jgi:hypothetical protein
VIFHLEQRPALLVDRSYIQHEGQPLARSSNHIGQTRSQRLARDLAGAFLGLVLASVLIVAFAAVMVWMTRHTGLSLP